MNVFFQLEERGSNVATEVRAGITTYLTMAYIIFVNPVILSKAGMDTGAVFVATCLAAAFGSLVMGAYANLPIALAPGMGLNAYFAFVVVPSVGGNWQIALGCLFIAGLAFFILSLTPLREAIVNAIPQSLRTGIAVGIGLFLAIIGLQNAGIIVDHPATLVTLGKMTAPKVGLACAGFILIAGLSARNCPGAIIIGILAVTLSAIGLGLQEFGGIVSVPPSISPTFLQLDIGGALTTGLVMIIFTFLLIDVLDTAGTLVGVGMQGYILGEDGKLPNLRKALLADSSATVVGTIFGTTTTTSYMESAAGIQEGGRTGLTAITVAILFLASLFFSPLAQTIPAYATAPALLFVATMMVTNARFLNWEEKTDYIPAVITALMMPLSYSIATGIGVGFITYVLLKLIAGKLSEINWTVVLISVLFALKLTFG